MADRYSTPYGARQASRASEVSWTPGSIRSVNASQLHEQLAASTNWNVAVRNARRLTAVTTTSSARRPITPPSVPIPDATRLNLKSDPADPIQSEHQLRMLTAFNEAGRLGLERAIYEESLARYNARPTPRSSWRSIIDDHEDQSGSIYRLLLLLPDKIIRALIKNTLSYEMHHDQEIRNFVNARMAAESSRPCAGIYINIPRRTVPDVSMMFRGLLPDMGKWLTYEEVRLMAEKVDVYIRNGSDINSQTQNYDLDKSLPNWAGKCSLMDRRWDISSASAVKVREWLDTIRKQFCTGVDPLDQKKPFVRCPYEVGWAQNIPDRLKQHVNNGSSTPIFELVNAITRQPRKDGGAGFPEPLQLMLFPIWKDDKVLPRLAEVLGSVLCSSYWMYGGLNVAEAGNSVSTTIDTRHAIWTASARDVHHRLDVFRFHDEEVERVTCEWDEAVMMDKREDSRAEVAQLRDEMDRVLKETAAEQQLLRQVKQTLREARHKLQTLLDEGKEHKSVLRQRVDALRTKMLKQESTKETVRALVDLFKASSESAVEAIREDLYEEDGEILNLAIDKYNAINANVPAQEERARSLPSQRGSPVPLEAVLTISSGTQSTDEG